MDGATALTIEVVKGEQRSMGDRRDGLEKGGQHRLLREEKKKEEGRRRKG